MSRYLISDHHFGHANIIEYCDRPFNSPRAMDSAMLDQHYETVESDDILIHLGDVAMDMQDGAETIECFDRLDGDLLVRGNHDVGLDPEKAPFPVVDATILEHDGYSFYCTHRPTDVPDSWDGWVIHGHHHDNDTEKFPFVDLGARRINVGVELLEYQPISLSAIVDLIDTQDGNTIIPDREAADLSSD